MKKFSNTAVKHLLCALAALSPLASSVQNVGAYAPMGKDIVVPDNSKFSTMPVDLKAEDWKDNLSKPSKAFGANWQQMLVTQDGAILDAGSYMPFAFNHVVDPFLPGEVYFDRHPILQDPKNPQSAVDANATNIAKQNTKDQLMLPAIYDVATLHGAANTCSLRVGKLVIDKFQASKGQANMPTVTNNLLSKSQLGKNVWIDRAGKIRNSSGGYLEPNGLTADKPTWTNDASLALILPQKTLEVLMALQIYDPATASYESKFVNKLHLDAEGYLVNDSGQFCNEEGTVVEESAKVKPDSMTVNGVSDSDYKNQSQFQAIWDYKNKDSVLRANQGDQRLVKRTITCMQGNKMTEIEDLETLTGGKVYNNSGELVDLKTAINATEQEKQIAPLKTIASMLKLDPSKVNKAGRRWSDKYTNRQKWGAGIISGATIMTGGTIAGVAIHRSLSAPPAIRSKAHAKNTNTSNNIAPVNNSAHAF